MLTIFPRLACLALAMLTGCATLPELTREEYLALVNRTYEGTSIEEGLAAAERLFRLADPGDVEFQHFENGFACIAHGSSIWSSPPPPGLTGRRDAWMTCEEAKAREKEGITYGLLEPLCSLTDDLTPE